MFGAGGGTSSYREIEETDVILLWGSNARETHPIFFHHVLQGVKRGAKLYCIDPRKTSSAAWADGWLGLHVGTDIALANGVAHAILAAGLQDQKFIERSTTGFEGFRDCVARYDLDRVAKETGVDANARCPICKMKLERRAAPAPGASSGTAGSAQPPAALAPPGSSAPALGTSVPGLVPVELTLDRVQLIGIRTAPATSEALVPELKTIGFVAPDEARFARVHARFTGGGA